MRSHFYCIEFDHHRENDSCRAAGENGGFNCLVLYPIPYMNNIPIATMGIGYDENMLNDLIETYYPLNSSIYLFNNQMTKIYTSWTDGLTDADKKR